jgi:hypothetical protein
MRIERFLIVARVTKRQLESFPAKGWVAVEVFNEEIVARERFHALRVPLEQLKVGAVLIRALTTPACEKIAFEKTVISKDADFWELQGTAEILRANAEQQEEWNRRVEEIGEREKQKRIAQEATAAARMAKPSPQKASNNRPVALAASGFAAVLAVGLLFGMRSGQEQSLDPAVARAREGTTTLIIPDATDPRILVEYALRPDGSRTVVRRLPREKMEAMGQADDAGVGASRPQQKNLVEAISGFFAFRQ